MYSQSRIYVACPAYKATGGTEVCHQLVWKLREKFGVDSYIYYLYVNPEFAEPPTHKSFEKYIGNNWVCSIEEKYDNVLIIPESVTEIALTYKKIRKVLWWLSVDNFFSAYGLVHQTSTLRSRIKKQIWKLLNKEPFPTMKNLLSTKEHSSIYLHLYQSEYARLFLVENSVSNILPLADYINKDFLEKKETHVRKNTVLYNPMKSSSFLKEIIDSNEDIKWVPIQKMTSQEVSTLMFQSKVYVDFGHHPGKDRLPREAVLSGCLLVTNNKGSARNDIDIPIPSKFKFDESNKNILLIVYLIKSFFEEYDYKKHYFEHYHSKTLTEELEFERHILAMLKYLKISLL